MTTAHHLDIGAHTPGSGGIVDAIDCYAEGLRFQAIKVYEAGKRNQQVWNMLRTNIRLPDLVLGDMEAQIAAARIGAQRYIELIEQHGLATIVGRQRRDVRFFRAQDARGDPRVAGRRLFGYCDARWLSRRSQSGP